MGHDLPVLMAIRVQGIAPVERLACAIGCDGSSAEERAASLVDQGLAMQRDGRVVGYTLTRPGGEALGEALEDEGLRGDDMIRAAYERFLPLNDELLRIASDWQVRKHAGVETPNDHSDPHYDQAILDRLFELHDRTLVVCRRASKRSPRYGPYRDRFERCVDRLAEGDRDAFTAALAESYHTVWFELHQDFLLTLGLEREA